MIVRNDEQADTLDCEVLVVGAGPSGLLTTLLLAQSGVRVILVEALPDIDDSPRAMAYGPAAVVELERAGVAQDARAVGMEPGDYNSPIRWITIDQKEIGRFGPEDKIPGTFDNVICGQYQLAEILKRHASRYENTKILFDHKIDAIDEAEGSVVATLLTSSGERKLSAKYLVGCDGGRSTVRKLLGLSYDGFTLPQWLVACNVSGYPFLDHGFTRGQFIIHPEHFCLIGKINPQGLWRVSYNEKEDLTKEEVLANVHNKFEAMFPGPKPLSKDSYKLEAVSPYRLHQRTAPSYRKGRCLLAGDAAHACSPFGGMGLTTGICDAAGVADCLVGVLRKGCPDSLLDKYAEIRKDKYDNVTHPVSYGNTCRLRDTDPEKAGELEFFKIMNSSREARQEMMKGAYVLGHDFRQYWPKVPEIQHNKEPSLAHKADPANRLVDV
ncbi:Para-nitrophenol 4-monooxygenase [Cyphellophora attinorum]|uniref:Para-nitrophenol 4-monooxygenase n=1 Tax=Cyphellophora attinorum TaxID=1664694 RepID=A0A0N0NL79_9EURO|nr:Para-nitrophenol 4-monooxygenase [Phialophora attinorum]KPI38868.1 Para-nitrophenol 4-monooxygenase [Phialophora attinorum]